jgi:hypothetical protein
MTQKPLTILNNCRYSDAQTSFYGGNAAVYTVATCPRLRSLVLHEQAQDNDDSIDSSQLLESASGIMSLSVEQSPLAINWRC